MNEDCPAVQSGSIDPVATTAAHIIEQRMQERPHGVGLCFRCSHAFIVKRKSDFEAKIICQRIGKLMPPDIDECSAFAQQGQLGIWDLAQICKVVDTRPKETGPYL